MKIIILSGTLIFALSLLALVSALPIRAQADNLSDNIGLADLLPDIERIYQEALSLPYQEAGKQIYDEEIAAFYNLLLQRTGLGAPPAQ
ncbi:MAG: hypothetical protein KKF26_00805 [Chloroflexi bacterium]|nr:hypothetical protein [Chloroflexota bacterium]